MPEQIKNRYMANWFLNPKQTLKTLGIKATLKMEDWLPLKDYPFGELGYDYEEGLRFRGTFKQIGELCEFIKKFHADNNIAFLQTYGTGKNKRDVHVFQISCCSSDDKKAFERAIKKTDLVLHPKYNRTFILTDIELCGSCAGELHDIKVGRDEVGRACKSCGMRVE